MTFNVDQSQPALMTFGRKGSVISTTGGDAELASTVKAVYVITAGQFSYRPRGETTGSITITDASVGFIPPHVPGVIFATGLTASLATIED